MKEQIIESLRLSLPALVTRQEIERQTGKLIKARHLANLDVFGMGVDGKMKFKGKVVYEKEAFLRWFSKNLKDINV
jgi:hypothetical protein